jgi:hypothetical protein
MEIEEVPGLFIIILVSLIVTTIPMDNPDIYIDTISHHEVESIKCVIQEDYKTIHCHIFNRNTGKGELFFTIKTFPENILRYHFTLPNERIKIIDLSDYMTMKGLELLVDCKKPFCSMELKDNSTMEFFWSGEVMYIKWDKMEDTLIAIHH